MVSLISHFETFHSSCENVKHRRHCHHDLCHRGMRNFMKTMMNTEVQLLVASSRCDPYQIQLSTQCSIFLSENTQKTSRLGLFKQCFAVFSVLKCSFDHHQKL